MTNLEFYKDELKKKINTKEEIFIRKNLLRGIVKFIDEHFDEIDFEGRSSRFIDWLCEEHKEPIKLKKWEKELLEIHYNYADNSRYFNNWNVLYKMKVNGHFKGVSDTSMTPEKILDNCEVVDDD